jgi:fatty-acyl-CoA synthase
MQLNQQTLQSTKEMDQSAKVYRTELTPLSFLRRSAYLFPEKTAVIYGDRRYTYKEFEERVNRLASRLRKADLLKGDRVAFLCPNSPPMLEAHFAVPAAGNVLVSINTRLAKDEVKYILEHSKSKMVFVDHELEELIEDVHDTVEVVHNRQHRQGGRSLRGLPGRGLAGAGRERP